MYNLTIKGTMSEILLGFNTKKEMNTAYDTIFDNWDSGLLKVKIY